MLVRDADAREVSSGDDSVLAQLDDASREHFEYLQRSIGQNFISILNDPDAKHSGAWGSTGNEWGSWLGKAVTAVAGAAGGAVGATEGPGAAQQGAAAAGTSAAVATQAQQAMAQLMIDGAPTEFDEYLGDVTGPYRGRRRLDQDRNVVQMQTMLGGRGSSAATAASGGTTDEGTGAADVKQDGDQPASGAARPALPASVALEYASDSFDVRRVVDTVMGDEGFGLPQAAVGAPSPPRGSSAAAVTKLSSATAGEAIAVVDATVQDLERQHNAVKAALMAHVHAHSRDFFLASEMFEDLVGETRGALRAADATRRDVQDGGTSLVHSFLRIASLSRRQRNTNSLRKAVATVKRLHASTEAIDNHIADREFSKAAAALRSTQEDFDASGGADFAALDTVREKLAARTRQLHSAVVDAAGRMVSFESWDDVDWAQLGDTLAAARDVGGVDEALKAYEREAQLGTADAVLQTLIRRDAVPPDVSLRALRRACDDPTSDRDPAEVLLGAARTAVATGVHRMRPHDFAVVVVEALDALMSHLNLCRGHMQLVAEAMDASAALHAGPQGGEGADANSSPLSSPAQSSPTSGLPTSPASLEGEPRHAAWMRRVVTAVATAAQERIVWFFDGRDDESVANFGPAGFDRLVRDVIERVAAFESRATTLYLELGGAPGWEAPGLWSRARACLGQHTKVFFKRHHDRLFERMVMVLSTELWEAQPSIAGPFKGYVAQLVASDDATIAATLGASTNISGKPDELPPMPPGYARQAPGSPTGPSSCPPELLAFPGSDDPPSPMVAPARPTNNDDADNGDLFSIPDLHGDRFAATNSLLLLLQMLAEYDWFNRRFPLLSHDVALRVHDAVKLFDGQCFSLVLGGGAVDQGVIESVTPKHIAVAAQSIAFLAALLPKVQRRFARLANAKAMGFTKNLERVAKDLAEHRTAFLERLVDMFRQRIKSATVEPPAWASGAGNAFVLGMLRECMRYWVKGLKPLLGHCGVAERTVVIGLVNVMARRIREVATQVTSMDAVPKVREDLIVFKTNVENLLGYGVVACGKVVNLQAAASTAGQQALLPNADAREPDGTVLDYLGCGASMDV